MIRFFLTYRYVYCHVRRKLTFIYIIRHHKKTNKIVRRLLNHSPLQFRKRIRVGGIPRANDV